MKLRFKKSISISFDGIHVIRANEGQIVEVPYGLEAKGKEYCEKGYCEEVKAEAPKEDSKPKPKPKAKKAPAHSNKKAPEGQNKSL